MQLIGISQPSRRPPPRVRRMVVSVGIHGLMNGRGETPYETHDETGGQHRNSKYYQHVTGEDQAISACAARRHC